MLGNPNAYLPDVLFTKATNWNEKLGRLCDIQQPSGAKQRLAQKDKPTSSSSTAKAKPAAKTMVKKRPAAQKLDDMD